MTLVEGHKKLVALCNAKDFETAAPLAETLANSFPDQPALWHLLACVQTELKALDAAEAAFERTLTLAPDFVAGLYNFACLLQRKHNLPRAAELFERVIALEANHVSALNNLGNVLRDLGQVTRAISVLKKAVTLSPSHLDARFNLATAHAAAKELDQAIAACLSVLEHAPAHAPALALLLQLKGQVCDFSCHAQFLAVKDTLGIQGDPIPPFGGLVLEDHPARQARRSENAVAAQFGEVERVRLQGRQTDKIRIGYFSANFCEHPEMHLMAGVFRAYDRARFEVFAYSARAHAENPHAAHVKANAAQFHDVSAMSDPDIAALARAHKLDIAIDLNGHLHGARLGMFALGAAPVQITFLGYSGTSGAAFFDYVVADRTVIPASERPHYSENVIFLGKSYMPNDNARPIGLTPARKDCGLPEHALVLCCFNNGSKIGPEEFDIWMRILRETPDSVLWLRKSNRWMAENLALEAKARGVARHRLVFAEKVPMAEHLARHALADIFVDTFNYNAHTTAVDALWSGLPVVTLAGKQFSARVGASLLGALGMNELITHSRDAYEGLIRDLAKDEERRAHLKKTLAHARIHGALFDTKGFVRNFEAALQLVHSKSAAGLMPSDVCVP